jgi:hypothetical protein
VDPRTRKLAGWAVAAAGVVIALVGVFADSLGIGANEGGSELGGRQIAALVVGLVILAVGLAVALLPLGQKEST